jgi:hypothetical protein
MAGSPWLDLPFMELTRENVRAEAARRGLSFRKLMDFYYRQDPERFREVLTGDPNAPYGRLGPPIPPPLLV